MGIWRDLFEGFTDGVITATVYQAQTRSYSNGACERGRIERLCRELGWAVDERDGNDILLHFSNSGGGIRKVRIAAGDEELVLFSAFSFALIPAANVSTDLMGYLLTRNFSGGAVGAWGVYVADDANVLFLNTYQALGAGLDAPALKFICESLVKEAAAFDGKLRESGLLR